MIRKTSVKWVFTLVLLVLLKPIIHGAPGINQLAGRRLHIPVKYRDKQGKMRYGCRRARSKSDNGQQSRKHGHGVLQDSTVDKAENSFFNQAGGSKWLAGLCVVVAIACYYWRQEIAKGFGVVESEEEIREESESPSDSDDMVSQGVVASEEINANIGVEEKNPETSCMA